MTQLQGSPGLLGAAPFLDTDAMLSKQSSMSGAIVRGIEPEWEPKVSSIADAKREGKLADLTPGSNRIILGRMLAYQLQVGLGDTVVVMIPGNSDANGGAFTPRLQEFEVVGTFEVGLQEHDSVLALVNIEDAEALRPRRQCLALVSRRKVRRIDHIQPRLGFQAARTADGPAQREVAGQLPRHHPGPVLGHQGRLDLQSHFFRLNQTCCQSG